MLSSLDFGGSHSPSVPRCLSTFHLYGPSYFLTFGFGLPMDLVASLFVSLGPIRPHLKCRLRLQPTLRPSWPLLLGSLWHRSNLWLSWPRFLSTFGLYGSRYSSTFGFGLPMALVASSASHAMAYTTLSETQSSTRPTHHRRDHNCSPA